MDTFYAEFDFVSVETALKAVWASDGSGKMGWLNDKLPNSWWYKRDDDGEPLPESAQTKMPSLDFVAFLPLVDKHFGSTVHPLIDCGFNPIPEKTPGGGLIWHDPDTQLPDETKEQQARRLFRSEE